MKKEKKEPKYNIEINKDYNSNPKNINLIIDLISHSFSFVDIDNTFIVFNTINNLLYLIYTSLISSIICYNLNDNKKVIEIKNVNKKYITNYRHFLDKKNKRDLIMSISFEDNNLKIWDVYNWECILNIQKANKYGFLISGYFLNSNNENYIITSNCKYEGNSEPIKIYDFNGNKIKEINDSCDKTFFIDVYYYNLLSKIYIIACHYNYIKSYDYNTNQLYNKYYDNDNKGHLSSIVNESDGIIKLIESCIDGNIRIWNFNSGLLINKIRISNNKYLYGICLWNKDYLFVGCEDKTIKLIDLKNKSIVKSIIGHNNGVLAIKKAIHPTYGECLFSQGLDNDKIKLLICPY